MILEEAILSSLVFNEDFTRKVSPYLKTEYFEDRSNGVVYSLINEYLEKYNHLPTKEVLLIELRGSTGLPEDLYEKAKDVITSMSYQSVDLNYMVDKTEEFCKQRACILGIMDSISILDGSDKNRDRAAVLQVMQDALAVSFDSSIGHDFFQNAMERYETYKQKVDRIPFDIDYLNKITNGGVLRKTLNILLAGTGGGKTLTMCHMAAGNLLDGKNVLYITMEMSEEKIAERIDANLLDTPVQELIELPQMIYLKRIEGIQKKTIGQLIIKEYPTAGASAMNFKSLLRELKVKKNFEPDVVYIDYLNICASSRFKGGANVGTYMYVKAIAEELRGLAVEHNFALWSATQLTRSGYGSSDIELTDTSESFALPATADLMIGLISTEDLDKKGQILVKQLKNRYNDPNRYRKFFLGIDRGRMRLYNLEESAQDGLVNDTPVFDATTASAKLSDSTKAAIFSLKT